MIRVTGTVMLPVSAVILASLALLNRSALPHYDIRGISAYSSTENVNPVGASKVSNVAVSDGYTKHSGSTVWHSDRQTLTAKVQFMATSIVGYSKTYVCRIFMVEVNVYRLRELRADREIDAYYPIEDLREKTQYLAVAIGYCREMHEHRECRANATGRGNRGNT
jgi:hypothetical protein